ncbi:MAG: zinc-dependent metalloprotease, partial [Candidatus Dormibacteria bacterium]
LAPSGTANTSLYMVEPNIESWEARAAIDPDAVRRWLVLHEVTHAWEFEAHPWLRGHIDQLIRELIANRLFSQQKPAALEVLRALTVGARAQWQAVSEMQAVMSLLEGFSNVVMRRVGEAHLRDYAAIDEEFTRRSGSRSAAERAFFRITGLEMKMQQYVQGERFCDRVIAEVGMGGLRRVWSGPASLPTLDEIRNPSRWISRQALTGAAAH